MEMSCKANLEYFHHSEQKAKHLYNRVDGMVRDYFHLTVSGSQSMPSLIGRLPKLNFSAWVKSQLSAIIVGN